MPIPGQAHTNSRSHERLCDPLDHLTYACKQRVLRVQRERYMCLLSLAELFKFRSAL